MMGIIDSATRPDEDCYGDGLYNYCLGLQGASGWVFGNSLHEHDLIDWYKRNNFWHKHSPDADFDGEDKQP